jgi:hypothetical protein
VPSRFLAWEYACATLVLPSKPHLFLNNLTEGASAGVFGLRLFIRYDDAVSCRMIIVLCLGDPIKYLLSIPSDAYEERTSNSTQRPHAYNPWKNLCCNLSRTYRATSADAETSQEIDRANTRLLPTLHITLKVEVSFRVKRQN